MHLYEENKEIKAISILTNKDLHMIVLQCLNEIIINFFRKISRNENNSFLTKD